MNYRRGLNRLLILSFAGWAFFVLAILPFFMVKDSWNARHDTIRSYENFERDTSREIAALRLIIDAKKAGRPVPDEWWNRIAVVEEKTQPRLVQSWKQASIEELDRSLKDVQRFQKEIHEMHQATQDNNVWYNYYADLFRPSAMSIFLIFFSIPLALYLLGWLIVGTAHFLAWAFRGWKNDSGPK